MELRAALTSAAYPAMALTETVAFGMARLSAAPAFENLAYQKELIERVKDGEEDDPSYILRAMETLVDGFREDGVEALPDHVDRFGSTLEQENMEGKLFALLWPVVTGKADAVPEIPSWRQFQGNLQAYLYGFIDLVSEMAKAVGDEVAKPDMTTEREFAIFERYLAIADSIVIALSTVRHSPGYVINNGYGRWSAFTNRLRGIQGTVAHVQRDYSSRRSTQRMIGDAIETMVRQVLTELRATADA